MNSQPLTEAQIFERIRPDLVELARAHGVRSEAVHLGASLVDDLGIDSLKFVDLTLAIERRLGLCEFPMQIWADLEMQRDGDRFSVASLVHACAEAVQNPDPATT
jgi:acyl carrier protein